MRHAGRADACPPCAQPLQALVADGFVLPLHEAFPPPRYGLRERASGTPWGGYREAQGRCLTQALLEGVCWLLHVGVGQLPTAPLALPPRPPGTPQLSGVGATSPLSVYSGCGPSCATMLHIMVLTRALPAQAHVRPATARPRCARPVERVDRATAIRLRCDTTALCPPQTLSCLTFAGDTLPPEPWLLNVPRAHAELAAAGPHAVVAEPGSVAGRAACTKCRGMNPLLGACRTCVRVD